MKYFLPAIFDPEESEGAYARIRDYATKSTQMPVTEGRIDCVFYRDEEEVRSISVGEWSLGATVQCIFEGDGFYIVCSVRQDQLAEPRLIDRNAVTKVVFFDGFGPSKSR